MGKSQYKKLLTLKAQAYVLSNFDDFKGFY